MPTLEEVSVAPERLPPTLVAGAIRAHMMQVIHAYEDLDAGLDTLRSRRVRYALERMATGDMGEDLAVRSAVHAAVAPEPGTSVHTDEVVRVVRRAFGRITNQLYTNEQILATIEREFGVVQRFDITKSRSVLDGVRVTP